MLTMLGMIIGTSSIIAVLGRQQSRVDGGSPSTLTRSATPESSLPSTRTKTIRSRAAIQYRDVRTIANDVGGMITYIEPMYSRNYALRWNGKSTTTYVASGSPHSQFTFTMRTGRKMDESDVTTGAHVCLITSELGAKILQGHLAGRRGARPRADPVHGDRRVQRGQEQPVQLDRRE